MLRGKSAGDNSLACEPDSFAAIASRSSSDMSRRANQRSSLTRAKSAFAARSLASAIAALASNFAAFALLARKMPIATSANTPSVITVPPIAARVGHVQVLNACHSSGPDSIAKPSTTTKPAIADATSSQPSPIPMLCFLTGPFNRRYRGYRKRSGIVPTWIIVVLAVAFLALACSLFTRVMDLPRGTPLNTLAGAMYAVLLDSYVGHPAGPVDVIPAVHSNCCQSVVLENAIHLRSGFKHYRCAPIKKTF